MKMRNCRKQFVMFLFLLTGCVTQGVNTFKYEEPSVIKVNNEITVDKPYTKVWDGLVKEISKSFYIINNIDKESRIINVSFSTNELNDYIDCGKTHRTYTQGDKMEKFDYDVAGSSVYKRASDTQPHPSWALYAIYNRKTSLEGRSNIYIAPSEKDNNITVVSVNTRNIFTIKVFAEAFIVNANGNIISKGPINTPPIDSISFNTNAVGAAGGIDPVKCISKGKLEKEILGIISRL